METLGWEAYCRDDTTFAGNVPFGYPTPVISKAGPVSLAGTDYIDIQCSSSTTNAIHPNPNLNNVIARIPMNALAERTAYTRPTTAIQAATVNVGDLSNIHIQLVDEWGHLFYLPDNQTVSLTLSLFPITSSF